MSNTEQMHEQDLERLKLFRYIDDDFMTVCLADNVEGVELILRILLGRDDIKIKSVRTQEPMKNLQGRSAVLDYSDKIIIPIFKSINLNLAIAVPCPA